MVQTVINLFGCIAWKSCNFLNMLRKIPLPRPRCLSRWRPSACVTFVHFDAICWISHDVRHTNAAGERRCSGGPGLKSSQTYPKMCLVHKRCRWVACVHVLVVCPGFIATCMWTLPCALLVRFGKAVAEWWAGKCDQFRSNGTSGFNRTCVDVLLWS